jgi:multicomponent Na+:H+ antiporter subunit B
MKQLTWLVLAVAIGVMFYAASDLPPVGDPQAPASRHVSPRYVARGYEETGAPNFVTAVVVDYRSYDTLGEITVIFTAGLACLLILGVRLGPSQPTPPEEES